MDSERAAKELFIEHLNVLRHKAGNPSLAWLEQLSGRKLVKTTLDDHLSGRRAGLPPWQLVAAYVDACHHAADATGLDARKLGSLQEWHASYQAALERDSEVPCPIQALSTIRKAPISAPEIDDDLTTSLPDTDDVFPTIIGNNDPIAIARTMPRESAILFVARGPGAGECLVVNEDITIIGRDVDSRIQLDDRSVSRRHSTITRNGSQFTIRDIGSRNGTFVNQKLIDSRLLKSGDVIHIGVIRLLFFQGGSAG